MSTKKNCMHFHITTGKVIKEIIGEIGWDVEKLARNLTIQNYRNLPINDRSDFLIPINDLNASTSDKKEIDILIAAEGKTIIENYISNKYKKSNSILVISRKVERTLSHSISTNSVRDYLSGRTPVPTLALLSFCQLFQITLDAFMTKVYEKMNMEWFPATSNSELTIEQAYTAFFEHTFADRTDNRYVYNTNTQRHLLSSLFPDGKNRIELYFTYLPMKPNLRDLLSDDQELIIFQRGTLTFEMRDGMCHVTSRVKVGSQGLPTEYKGFAIVMNPHSNGTTCTCFIREINNTFGIFIIFSFRLSPLEQAASRKTRVSECMSVRRSDGTSFVYRLLISENLINDENMKYFARHLKLCTNDNLSDGRELDILLREKYFVLAKKYFEGSSPSNEYEKMVFEDLQKHFKGVNSEDLLNIINNLENSSNNYVESFRTVDSNTFNIQDINQLLFLSWVGNHSLSAGQDRINYSYDDDVENIHKQLYPELHKNTIDPRIYPHF